MLDDLQEREKLEDGVMNIFCSVCKTQKLFPPSNDSTWRSRMTTSISHSRFRLAYLFQNRSRGGVKNNIIQRDDFFYKKIGQILDRWIIKPSWNTSFAMDDTIKTFHCVSSWIKSGLSWSDPWSIRLLDAGHGILKLIAVILWPYRNHFASMRGFMVAWFYVLTTPILWGV